MTLFRTDISLFTKKKKDVFGRDLPDGAVNDHRQEKVTEVCSKMIVNFDDAVIPEGQHQYPFAFEIPADVVDNFDFEEDRV